MMCSSVVRRLLEGEAEPPFPVFWQHHKNGISTLLEELINLQPSTGFSPWQEVSYLVGLYGVCNCHWAHVLDWVGFHTKGQHCIQGHEWSLSPALSDPQGQIGHGPRWLAGRVSALRMCWSQGQTYREVLQSSLLPQSQSCFTQQMQPIFRSFPVSSMSQLVHNSERKGCYKQATPNIKKKLRLSPQDMPGITLRLKLVQISVTLQPGSSAAGSGWQEKIHIAMGLCPRLLFCSG